MNAVLPKLACSSRIFTFLSCERNASSGLHSPFPKILITLLLVLIAIPITRCAQRVDHGNRTFFHNEYGLDTHGRKTWFDHLIEVDPGGIKTDVAINHPDVAPEKIAVLPFSDRGSANYVVDKIPLTHRSEDEEADWAWTDANRVRRAITGYLVQREFWSQIRSRSMRFYTLTESTTAISLNRSRLICLENG
jgi:hypothetical protein